MIDQISALSAEHGFTFAEVWLLSFFSIMWGMPLFWAVFLSAVFGSVATSAVRALITVIVILPVGKGGVIRFKQFILVWSYMGAQTTRAIPIRKITRARKVFALVSTLMTLLPGYCSVRDKNFDQLYKIAEDWCPFGISVWMNGVAIRVTWYPNFRWERWDEHLSG